MSIIYPGNYVAQLNAYRGQGVEAIPGFNFYSVLAVAEVIEGAGTTFSLGALEILSPDLRQDDKPRLNKAAVVPANAKVYQTSVSAVNVSGSGTDTLTVGGGALAAELTAVAGEFTDVTAQIKTADLALGTPVVAAAAPVTLTASGAVSPTKVADQSYVIVEYSYYLPAAAPSSDDVHVPFKVEAGQGT